MSNSVTAVSSSWCSREREANGLSLDLVLLFSCFVLYRSYLPAGSIELSRKVFVSKWSIKELDKFRKAVDYSAIDHSRFDFVKI